MPVQDGDLEQTEQREDGRRDVEEILVVVPVHESSSEPLPMKAT